MLKFWAHRVLCVLLVLVAVGSSVSSLRAHDEKGVSKKDIEAHRQTDFGFDGFKQLNNDLQKDFDNFDYEANAAAYRKSREMIAAAVTVNGFKSGVWSPVYNLPIVPIHVAMLPSGKFLMWDSVGDAPTESYPTHNTTRAIVWDPETGNIVRNDVYTGFNIFCAGHAQMSDGTQFIAGGNKNSSLDGLDTLHIFNPFNNSWNMIGRMSGERWYPSVTAMPNGEMLITSGGWETPEVYNSQTGVRSLTNAVLSMPLYPWLEAAPNGKAFYFGPDDKLRYITTAGTGSVQNLGTRGDGLFREYGSYAMYDIGKVVLTGGDTSVKHTAVIDFNGATPQVSRANDIATGRRQHNLTVLPDGTVLATGGNSSGASLVDLNAGVYTAELWNPATGAWTTLGSMQKTRQYHSTAMLMPDGRVLSGGGGICGACWNVGYLEKNFEIFSPPYLFQRDGTPAPRPLIYDAPTSMSYANTYMISTDNPKNVKQIVLMRPASVTHSVNFDQRRIPLSFSNTRRGLQITAPSGSSIAPPGYYMMFVIDSKGVPSEAQMVKIS
jgi:hypothetical protein